MADNNLVVAGLNFDSIKINLRNYIANKPEFRDYDFSDSALNTLLDLLAYNTYYNVFYANMAANESFLDTAQFYDNVVSRAKALGYTPKSARGATANIQLIFTNSVANTTFRSIQVLKNTEFTTTVNGSSYTFVTPQTYTIAANSTNGFADYISIVEGEPITHRFVYNRTSNTQFVLPNPNVDTRSITVSVTTNGNTQSYVPVNDILTVNSSSQIFYVDADRDQKYKVYFGDNVLGKQPITDSLIDVSYRVTNGPVVNGSNTFTLVGSNISGQSSVFISPVGRASGGAYIEDIESIRFNAPRLYETQNRSVTKSDYERLILRDNPDIQAISVWGGEENDPPVYGKVFVALKPNSGTTVSLTRKNQIYNTIRKYNVQSIDVQFVDPTYLYIIPEITVRYNPDQTSLTAGELASLVSQRVVNFENSYLNNFGNKFRYSRFLDYIDGADASIQGTTATIRLRKTFVPSVTNLNTYTIRFNTKIQRLGDPTLIRGVSRHPGFGTLTSSPFVFQQNTSYFDDNGFGSVRIYYPSTAGRLGRVYTNFTAGVINYETGQVDINNFVPSSYTGNSISIIASPLSPDIFPIRNQILLLSQSEVKIVDDNSGTILATASNIETLGQAATLPTPSTKLYNF